MNAYIIYCKRCRRTKAAGVGIPGLEQYWRKRYKGEAMSEVSEEELHLALGRGVAGCFCRHRKRSRRFRQRALRRLGRTKP